MKVLGVFLLILGSVASVFGASDSDFNTSSHEVKGFIGRGLLVLGTEEVRTGGGIGYAYARREPRFFINKIPAQVVYEGYFETTKSPGVFGAAPDTSFAVGGLAYARWLLPANRHGLGAFVDLGWGLQAQNHATDNLDSIVNSTPLLQAGATIAKGKQEFMLGARYLHISNAGTKGHNKGENQLFLLIGFRY